MPLHVPREEFANRAPTLVSRNSENVSTMKRAPTPVIKTTAVAHTTRIARASVGKSEEGEIE